ncbi:DUF4328 domain-containing protein [bacterium]|nr:DUF4328 domain-containing protein [bacterium]
MLSDFKSGWSGARGMGWLLGSGSALLVVSALGLLGLSFGYAPGTGNVDTEAPAFVLILLPMALGLLGIFGAIIPGLIWVYRSNVNCSKLGAVYLRFTPGWAVNWFFVPLLSYWKPAQVLGEIWRESQPRTADGQPSRTSSAWVTLSWAAMLICGIAGQILINSIDPNSGRAFYPPRQALMLMALGCLLLAGGALIAALGIRRIDRQQNVSAELRKGAVAA